MLLLFSSSSTLGSGERDAGSYEREQKEERRKEYLIISS